MLSRSDLATRRCWCVVGTCKMLPMVPPLQHPPDLVSLRCCGCQRDDFG